MNFSDFDKSNSTSNAHKIYCRFTLNFYTQLNSKNINNRMVFYDTSLGIVYYTSPHQSQTI